MSSEFRVSRAPTSSDPSGGVKGEAERCRSQARDFVGRPEHAFLLEMANAFDALESGRSSIGHSAIS